MIKINLLPPEKRKKLKKVKAKKGAGKPLFSLDLGRLGFDPFVVVPIAAAVVVIGFAVGSFFWLGYREGALADKRVQMKQELRQLNRIMDRINFLKTKTKDLSQRMEVIREVDRNRFIWPRILDNVSSALPRFTWLDIISEKTPFPQLRVRFEGITMSNLLLSHLMTSLEQTEMLENVELISSTEKIFGNLDTKYFIIECDCALNITGESSDDAAK